MPLAGYLARLLAKFVDGLLVTTVGTMLTLPLLLDTVRRLGDYFEQIQEEINDTGRTPVVNPLEMYTETGLLTYLVVLQAVFLIVGGLYTVLLIHFKGATVGKMATGVRVRPWAAEGRPSWGQAVKRWLTGEFAAVISLYWLIDVLWPLWDDRKQALHDKWPGTVVVRRP